MGNLLLNLAIAAAIWCVAVTEVLSAFHALRPVLLGVAWVLFGCGAAAWLWRVRPGVAVPRPEPLEFVPIAAVGVVLSGTLLTIALCPPNNWDVILYHLPRQVQWLQQGGVQHFPTQDYRLTVNPPLAEYLGVNLMALAGSDRLNALVSWAGLLLTITTVSLLASELGAGRLGQWIAAAFAATIPIGIHEAVSGKNDGVVAFFLAAATLQLLRLWNAPAIPLRAGLLLGAAIGLLALTKGTGAVFGVPIVLFALLRLAWKRPPGGGRACLAAMLVVSAINAPHLARNLQAYGSAAGQSFGLVNERRDAGALGSNLIRNAAMHLALPGEAWNRAVEQWVVQQHERLGWRPDDPATTWGGGGFHLEHGPHTETATAPWHLLLGTLAVGILLISRDTRQIAFALVLAGGVLAFCMAWKWQPWHPRLHLPLLALAGAAAGRMFEGRLRLVSPLIVVGLAGAAMPALLASEYRTLLGSRGLSVWRHSGEELRFHGRGDILTAAQAAVRACGDARHVDLINHPSLPWEYPLTRLLKRDHNQRHVGYFYPVRGSPPAPPPDAVVALGEGGGPVWLRHSSGAVYRAEHVHGPFTVYLPQPADRAPAGAVMDHAVGRFGIGAEPPAHFRSEK